MHLPAGKTPSSAFAPGTRLGSYEVLQPLGSGGMGEVYRAHDTRLGRDIAIKIISLGRDSTPEARLRFEREARSASALNHPNIVTIYELGQVDGLHYIAMELVGGQTMRELLASGPLAFQKAVAIAAQVADALAKAHEIGIVHRDLKPENLMVSLDGIAKILDFGLAKLAAPDDGQAVDGSTLTGVLTEPGRVMGTLAYMSPEQANGEKVDFRSDQFSFGAVLYEMIAGLPAFRGRTHAEITAAILRDEPERIASRTLNAPAPFLWIIERCLAKDPRQRYSSTRDLARDLAAVRDRLADAPAHVAEPRPSNLPVQRTAFIGREREVEALRQLLLQDGVSLVTLTGPGGIGKTRLALRVAGEIAGEYPGGICFVSLATVRDVAFIPAAIAQAAGLHETPNQPALETLKEHLRRLPGPMLLVVDNFEHLVAGAPLVADLLSVGSQLNLVVTSQAPLHVYGEHEFPVPPLALPDPQSIPPLDVLAGLPAVALFLERARAVKRDFALTRQNAPAIAAICARLDGLPLAIELAAARIKLLSPAAMQTRLESSLHLLTGGARDLPTRQQTLRSTIDWSYGLLNAAEQKLFRRLAVFVGGCTLEGAEAVCDTKSDLGIDVLDGMASVVDKSLVQQVEHVEGEARFIMLSTIREYALERLAESGEEVAVRRAHAAYCLVLAEEGASDASGPTESLDRFDAEHDNFRAALDSLIQAGNAEWGLRLGAALFRFWETREHLTEARDFLNRLLQCEGAAAWPKLRARLLFAAAVLAGEQGDYASARHLLEDSLGSCQALGDKHGVAVALNALAVNRRDCGDLAAASSLFEQALAIWNELGYPADIARALSNLANVVKLQGDYARAASLYGECLTMFRKVGDHAGMAWTLNYQGDLARQRGDYAAARAFYVQSLAGFRQLQDGWGIAGALADLANLTRDEGNYSEAHRLYGESLKTFRDVGHKRGIARVLEQIAVSSAAQSNCQRSLRLAGAAAGLRQRLGAPLNAAEQAELDRALESARRALGNAAGLAAWMEGWAIPLDEAIDEALSSKAEDIRPAANSA